VYILQPKVAMVFTSSSSSKLPLKLKCGFLKYIHKTRAGMGIAR
jgi:hypothetical protein